MYWPYDGGVPELALWNPWWRLHEVPDYLHGTPRSLTEEVWQLDSLRHIKGLVGVRRAGKTTILRQVVKRHLDEGRSPQDLVFLNFDAPDLSEASFDAIDEAIATQAPEATHLFLDEVQQRSGWERWVRVLYDQRRFERIYVTGSSAHLLAGDLGRVLTGRHLTFHARPFSFSEWWAHQHQAEPRTHAKVERNAALTQYLKGGGFPEAVEAAEEARIAVLVDLFHGIVERDVAARHGLDGPTSIRLARAFLRDAGKPYSVRRIAESCGVSADRAMRHLGHLLDSGLARQVTLFSHKRSPRVRRTAKLYCVDTGLLTAVVPRAGHEMGRLLEHAVAHALASVSERETEVHFFQDKHGVECDFVLTRLGKPTSVIQVAASVRDAETRKREERGLERAGSALGVDSRLIVVLDGDEFGSHYVSAVDFLMDPEAFLGELR